jgi:two-component system CheB/CheR fusion protein
VTVDVEREEEPAAGDVVVVRIRDDGLGIDPAMLPRVFDLFSRADHSLARPHGGLGVGLTIVRRVVELHGGRVEARSAGLGHGSEFVVRLPSADPPDPTATRIARESHAPAERESVARRILIVDDSWDGADTLARLLRADGHDVRTAADGRSALEAAEAFQPEVVLLDIGLPGMSGFEVAEHLRRRPGTSSTVLIALTGYGQERDRDRARQAGFDRHLTKPVDHPALLRLLRSATRGS